MILSFISIFGLDEFVAQSVEHLTFNQRVAGSNPTELTNKRGRLVRPFFVGAKRDEDLNLWGSGFDYKRKADVSMPVGQSR